MKSFAAAIGLALVATTAFGAAPPARYALPAEVRFPEGVAYDGSRYLYAGSALDGTIARVDRTTGQATAMTVPGLKEHVGQAFPGVLGLVVDPRGRLWAAGGRTGKVFVIDPRNGALLQTIETPDAATGLINDLAFAGGRAFFTDSLRPILWSVQVGEQVAAQPEPWLSFAATPIAYEQGANLNGIAATADGRTLLTGQMNKGHLFKIDVASKAVTRVDLKGALIDGVDGLVLRGRTLYVIHQPTAEVTVIELAPDMASGSVVSRQKPAGLLWPATAALVGDELVIVNTQFNKRQSNDPETPFTLQRLPLPAAQAR